MSREKGGPNSIHILVTLSRKPETTVMMLCFLPGTIVHLSWHSRMIIVVVWNTVGNLSTILSTWFVHVILEELALTVETDSSWRLSKDVPKWQRFDAHSGPCNGSSRNLLACSHDHTPGKSRNTLFLSEDGIISVASRRTSRTPQVDHPIAEDRMVYSLSWNCEDCQSRKSMVPTTRSLWRCLYEDVVMLVIIVGKIHCTSLANLRGVEQYVVFRIGKGGALPFIRTNLMCPAGSCGVMSVIYHIRIMERLTTCNWV